jgi:hypothetical protein
MAPPITLGGGGAETLDSYGLHIKNINSRLSHPHMILHIISLCCRRLLWRIQSAPINKHSVPWPGENKDSAWWLSRLVLEPQRPGGEALSLVPHDYATPSGKTLSMCLQWFVCEQWKSIDTRQRRVNWTPSYSHAANSLGDWQSIPWRLVTPPAKRKRGYKMVLSVRISRRDKSSIY